MIGILIVFRHSDEDAAAGNIDGRHGFASERQQNAVAIGPGDLHHIARAVIVDGGNLAQQAAFAVLRFQPDQIGVIEFFRRRVRQGCARRCGRPASRYRSSSGPIAC